MAVSLTDKLTYHFGLFPFRKGKFYEYSFNGKRAGTDLYTITDVTLQGNILSYQEDINYKFLL